MVKNPGIKLKILSATSPVKPIKAFKAHFAETEVKQQPIIVKESLSMNIVELERVFRDIYLESGVKDDITNIHNINIQKAHIKSYLSKRYNK